MRPSYLVVAAALVLAARPAHAQQPPERPMLGSWFTAPTLADLPTGGSLYSVFDTMPSEVIWDRVDTGGLFTGEAARVGSHGSSWTQTMFRLGDADITNPNRGGTPMLVPSVYAWDRVEITTGLMPIEMNAPGMGVSLVPRRPSKTWTRSAEIVATGPSLLARQTPANPPAIATQHTWTDGHVLLSGPIVPDRVGIVFLGGVTKSSRFERGDVRYLDSSLASAFTHLVFMPNPSNEVRAVGWVEHASTPDAVRVAFAQPLAAESGSAVHGQLTWEHKPLTDATVAVFADFTRRSQNSDLLSPSGLVVERLATGPIAELVNPRDLSSSTWAVGGRFASPRVGSARNLVRGGIGLSGSAVTARSTFNGRIGETIGGVPARVWDYTSPSAESQWGETLFSAYAADTIMLHQRLTLEAGLRFESMRASAEGSTSAIRWNNWLPRGNLRWELVDYAKIAAIAGFARYGNRLPLADLAYGDPSAPIARVFRWDTNAANPRLTDLGPLVSHVGPGTGGTRPTDFSSIDPKIVRPYMDEFIVGFESRPRAATVIRLAGLARREKQVLGVVNIGVPESSYTTSFITDPGDDHAGKQQLPVYNRPVSTFGLDRYLLTNPADNESTFVGVEISMQTSWDGNFVMAGATAGRSEALSATLGFTPFENDHGVLGDVFTNPNVRTFAQGRVFSERGYTIKTAGVFTLPWDMKFGFAARYSDGQHFARLVIVPGLNQGVEAVRAFRNGATRFTFTATLDGRLQKAFTVNSRQFAVLLDAYNVLNLAYEIEEYSITGPTSRLTSAVQPPRAVHLGLRVAF